MKKIFLLFVSVIIVAISFAQPSGGSYQKDPIKRQWEAGYFKAVHMPAHNGAPFIRDKQWRGAGALFLDTTANKFYYYQGGVFHWIPDSAGVVSILGGGLSYIDSIWRTPGIDTIYWRKNGVTYAVKDSTGGGGGTIGGTISANQVAFGSGANTITGTSGFTFDGSTIFSIPTLGKYRIGATQSAYIPNQTNFSGSMAFGTGLQQLVHTTAFDGWNNHTSGMFAGDSITIGFNNSLTGSYAGARLKGGFYNTYDGVAAGFHNEWGNENYYGGMSAAFKNKGSYSVVIGASAWLNCDSCETSNIFGNLAGWHLITANQSNLNGYRIAQSATYLHFSDLQGYRNSENYLGGIGMASYGHSGFKFLLTGDFHTGFGAFHANSVSGGRTSLYLGAYSGTNALQKVDPVHSFSIAPYSYNTRDFEGVVGSDSTKYIKLRATDSLQASLVRTTTYQWIAAYDSASQNLRYMPISLISGGGSSYTATLPLSISGSNVISMPKASATDSGWISTGTQTIAGPKTMTSDFTVTGSGSTRFIVSTTGSASAGIRWSNAPFTYSDIIFETVSNEYVNKNGAGVLFFRRNSSGQWSFGNGAPTPIASVTATSFASAIVDKSANYTATTDDNTINCTASGITITLPSAVSLNGKEYTVINSSSADVSVSSTSSQLIGNFTTATTVTVASNTATTFKAGTSSNWHIKN